MIKRIKDFIQGKPAKKRSPLWAKVRAEHLVRNPFCAVCGGTKNLDTHHILPFHEFPELELDTYNLITLCESKNLGVTCHLFFGHLGNYRKINKMVVIDAIQWREKLNATRS